MRCAYKLSDAYVQRRHRVQNRKYRSMEPKFGEDRTCIVVCSSSRDMLADRQTRQTDRHAHLNNPIPYLGWSNTRGSDRRTQIRETKTEQKHAGRQISETTSRTTLSAVALNIHHHLSLLLLRLWVSMPLFR